MPEKFEEQKSQEKNKTEVYIGRDTFGNELTIKSLRLLGKITEAGREVSEPKGGASGPWDTFTDMTKEIKFEDGDKELACRFGKHVTGSTASDPSVNIEYLSPDVQVSELERQSGEYIEHKPGHWGEHDLAKEEKDKEK